jgi:hypothetical protein
MNAKKASENHMLKIELETNGHPILLFPLNCASIDLRVEKLEISFPGLLNFIDP